MVLLGGMYGSDNGHVVAAKFSNNKIPSGFMVIHEGRSANTVVDGDHKDIGKLPFSIGLKDFWIEYYEDHWPWVLGVDAPPAGDSPNRRREVIDWVLGEEVAIPFVDVHLKAIQYLDSARAVYPDGAANVLEIIEADGKRTVVPAEVGQRVFLQSPAGTLRIAGVFPHLIVKDGEVMDLPGPNANPALNTVLERPDGKEYVRYILGEHAGMQGHGRDGLNLRYVLPAPTAAVGDPNTRLPAIEVLLRHEDKELRTWIIANSRHPTKFSLTSLLGHETLKTDALGRIHCDTYLVMARPRGPISDYKSSLIVLEKQQMVTEEVIEVNAPLHYSGYHFYQHSYGREQGEYTVLFVKSDSGLWSVYAGFTMLCVGTFWLFWVRPAWGHLSKRVDHGN